MAKANATQVKEELTKSPEEVRDETLIKMGDDAEAMLNQPRRAIIRPVCKYKAGSYR
jgi:hypothetical protein